MNENSAESLLYECLRELEYVQCVENCGGLCASDAGKHLIDKGCDFLGITELGEDTLAEQREHERIHGKRQT